MFATKPPFIIFGTLTLLVVLGSLSVIIIVPLIHSVSTPAPAPGDISTTQQPTALPTQTQPPAPTPTQSQPTPNPTPQPQSQPTNQPTRLPTHKPTPQPTHQPTPQPTRVPTHQPTPLPTGPTAAPTTSTPTISPTKFPSTSPTLEPTPLPSTSPTNSPTPSPSILEFSLPGASKFLGLCEIKAYDSSFNEIELSSAVQSSTTSSFTASKAIDGIIDAGLSQSSCSITTTSTDPNWRAEYSGISTISSLRIFNREADTSAANSLIGTIIYRNDVVFDTITSEMTTDGVRTINPIFLTSATVNEIRVDLPGTSKILTLCEIELYDSNSDLILISRVSQSSTEVTSGIATGAIDESRNTDRDVVPYCTETTSETAPWWRGYYVDTNVVDEVHIYNRADSDADRLIGAEVRVNGVLIGTVSGGMIGSNPIIFTVP